MSKPLAATSVAISSEAAPERNLPIATSRSAWVWLALGSALAAWVLTLGCDP